MTKMAAHRVPRAGEDGPVTTIAATPHATGWPGYTSLLPCEPESVQHARRLVAGALNTWRIPDMVDVAKLLVSELLTNTINHTPCGTAKVIIERRQRHIVRIGVADRSHTSPRLGTAAETAECGRGLFLVDVLSWRWGYDRHHWGKITWAELQVSAADESK